MLYQISVRAQRSGKNLGKRIVPCNVMADQVITPKPRSDWAKMNRKEFVCARFGGFVMASGDHSTGLPEERWDRGAFDRKYAHPSIPHVVRLVWGSGMDTARANWHLGDSFPSTVQGLCPLGPVRISDPAAASDHSFCVLRDSIHHRRQFISCC
jgi:hypothetical protein